MPNVLNKIPKSALNVLNILENRGYEAYIVGGAVRDMIMNRKVVDYDICTNALPEDVRKVFLENKYKVIETGIKHGTVTVVSNNASYEVTTFRSDGAYLDNRHPDKVNFNVSLEEDLKRRDFTINALACDANGKIYDFHGGIEDIHQKTIRTVGNPNTRFKEDALRMLRALRFKMTLKFEIEEKTEKAIIANSDLIKKVSIERINSETEKILDNCGRTSLNGLDIILRKAYDYNIHLNKNDKEVLKRMPDHIMKISYLYSKFKEDELNNRINSLRLSNEKRNIIKRNISVTIIKDEDLLDEYHIKKYLSKYGQNEGFLLIQYLCYLKNFDILIIKEKINSLSNSIVTLKTLDLDGEDLIELGYNGKQIGLILNQLVELVLKGKVKNEKKLLIRNIKKCKLQDTQN